MIVKCREIEKRSKQKLQTLWKETKTRQTFFNQKKQINYDKKKTKQETSEQRKKNIRITGRSKKKQ